MPSMLPTQPYSVFGDTMGGEPSGLQNPLTQPSRHIPGNGNKAIRRVRGVFQRELDAQDVSRVEAWYLPEEDVRGLVVYSRLIEKRPVLYLPDAYFERSEADTAATRLVQAAFDRCGVPANMWRSYAPLLKESYYLLVLTRERAVDGKLSPQRLDDEWRCETLDHWSEKM